jgi:hypothetical protein
MYISCSCNDERFLSVLFLESQAVLVNRGPMHALLYRALCFSEPSVEL